MSAPSAGLGPVPGPADALTLLVRQVRLEARGVHSFELVDADGAALPPFEAGAHLDVHVDAGLVRQYSLCNDPAERHRYVIAVLREDAGRGGSRAVHERLQVGRRVKVSAPRNHFALRPARRALLLAGGIGVTPLKAMAHALERAGTDYELHYCARDAAHAAFRDELARLPAHRVHHHFDQGRPAQGLDIAALLREAAEGTHVYCCGPAGFMQACAAATAHWPAGTVHTEHFKAPEPAADAPPAAAPGSFTVKLRSSDAVVTVGPDVSIVDALAAIGVVIDTSCQSGLCGTCKVRHVAGEVDHRDCIMDASEQADYLTACVSRGRGCVVLDL